jgi:hypothetical protein
VGNQVRGDGQEIRRSAEGLARVGGFNQQCLNSDLYHHHHHKYNSVPSCYPLQTVDDLFPRRNFPDLRKFVLGVLGRWNSVPLCWKGFSFDLRRVVVTRILVVFLSASFTSVCYPSAVFYLVNKGYSNQSFPCNPVRT